MCCNSGVVVTKHFPKAGVVVCLRGGIGDESNFAKGIVLDEQAHEFRSETSGVQSPTELYLGDRDRDGYFARRQR